eukprot:1152356-Pelagomonas_calceolata.AAC.1
MRLFVSGKLPLPEGTCVSEYACHGEGIEIFSSNCLMSGGDHYAEVWRDLEVALVASEHLPVVQGGNELHAMSHDDWGVGLALAQDLGSGPANSCMRCSLSSETRA